jgi:hypothetical protein
MIQYKLPRWRSAVSPKIFDAGGSPNLLSVTGSTYRIRQPLYLLTENTVQ